MLASAGLGYVSWLLAARLMAPEAFGVAAAVVSAGFLCSNIAILGLGTTVISFLPRETRDPAPLLNGFFTIVVLVSSICSVAFLLVTTTFLDQLRVLGSNAPLAAWFIGLAIATTVLLLLDGTSIAVRRADYTVVRGVVAGIAKLVVLVVAWRLSSLTAAAVLLAWFTSTLGACLLGYHHVRNVFPSYHYRPRIAWHWARVMLTNGLSNHALNLSRILPILVIPLVVTETLSASANAYWYVAWMIAFSLRFIPIATSQAIFAAITNKTVSLARGIKNGIGLSVIVSLLPVALCLAFAENILSIVGEQYAVAGTTPLRILVLGIVPQFAIEFYIVAHRVNMRLMEPNIVLGTAGALAIIAAAYGAHVNGLVGVAVGWVAVDTAAGAWAAARLVRLSKEDGSELD